MDVEPLTDGPATRHGEQAAGRRVLLEGPPGSGKSAAAFARARRRLESGVGSEGLLYILPTDALAEEARDRLARDLAPGVRDLWVTSLPGFCKKLLRQYDAFVPDLGPNPQILDGLEERLVVARVLETVELEFYDKARGLPGFADDLVDFIDAVKLAGAALPSDTPRWRDLGRVLRAYDAFLRERNLLDLRDLTRNTLELFLGQPAVLAEVRARARAVVVDGYQDFNAAEGEMLATLLAGMDDVLVAGDVGEAVLGFRGANAEGVRARLLEALRPEMVSLPARPRPTPETLRFEGAVDEAFGIARWLDRVTRVEGRAAFRDCAVLVRQAHAPEVRFLEEALADLGLPFMQLGTRHLLRGAMMAQIAAVLEVVAAPTDSLPAGARESSLVRALSAPAFGLSPADLQAVAAGTELSRAGRGVMRKFRAAAREVARGFDSEPLDVALYRTLLRFGFLAAAAETARADPLAGLLDLAEKFRRLSAPASSGPATLSGFLDYLEGGIPAVAAGVADLWRADAVRLLTAHEVRGRSFRFVAVAGVAEDRFPKLFDERGLLNRRERRALGIRQGTDPAEHLREERRLFALACASARDGCRVSSARVYEAGGDHAPSSLLAGLPAAAPEAGLRVSRPEEVARPADALQIWLATGEAAWEPLMSRRYDLDALRGLREGYSQRLLWDTAPLPPGHVFSVSQLETFHDCPARYFYRNRLRLESPDTFNRTLGNLVHAILEKFHERYASRDALRLPAVAGRAGDEPGRVIAELVESMIRPADAGSVYAAALARDAARRMLDAYLMEERAIPGETDYARREEGLEWTLQGEKFRGRLDRLDRLPSGEYGIVDYKTGGGQGKMERGLQSAIERGESMQLPLYVHGCRENRLPVSEASIYWLRREGRKRATLDLSKTESAFDAALKMAGERTATMREGQYPSAPREGLSACRMCDFKDLCNDEDKIL